MDDRSSFKQLRDNLRRRRLPEIYIERVIGELNDHRADLLEEGERRGLDSRTAENSASDRLGPVEQLADSVISEYQARWFLGRHPVFAFLVAPALMTVLGWILFYGFGFATLINLYEARASLAPTASWAWIFRATERLSWVLPPVLVAYFAYRLAHCTARGWPWILAAHAVVAFLWASSHSQVMYSELPGKSKLMFGFGVSQNLLLAVAACAIAGLYAWRSERFRRLVTH